MWNAKRDDFRDQIERTVTSWPGVTVEAHRFDVGAVVELFRLNYDRPWLNHD